MLAVLGDQGAVAADRELPGDREVEAEVGGGVELRIEAAHVLEERAAVEGPGREAGPVLGISCAYWLALDDRLIVGFERLAVLRGAPVGADRCGALRVLFEHVEAGLDRASGSSRSSASRKTRKSPLVLRMPRLRGAGHAGVLLAQAADPGVAGGDRARRCRLRRRR